VARLRVYHNDAIFQRLCKFLEQFLETCQLTPADLRAVVMFVVARHEMRHPPSVHITIEEWTKLIQLHGIDPETLPNLFPAKDEEPK
jgi:hypothetical protein